MKGIGVPLTYLRGKKSQDQFLIQIIDLVLYTTTEMFVPTQGRR